MNARLTVALVVTALGLASLAGVNCGSPNNRADPNTMVRTSPTPNLGDFDVAEYFDVWNGDVSLPGFDAHTVTRRMATNNR